VGTISQERIRGLTQAAFEKLLRGLDPDRSAAGDKYENLRRKLARFFAWEGCEFGEDLADEALNRLARKLDEGEQIGGMERYAFGVARLMLKEEARCCSAV
jgi:DNA-directed RNA polymerase specialized sigma24 family protein